MERSSASWPPTRGRGRAGRVTVRADRRCEVADGATPERHVRAGSRSAAGTTARGRPAAGRGVRSEARAPGGSHSGGFPPAPDRQRRGRGRFRVDGMAGRRSATSARRRPRAPDHAAKVADRRRTRPTVGADVCRRRPDLRARAARAVVAIMAHGCEIDRMAGRSSAAPSAPATAAGDDQGRPAPRRRRRARASAAGQPHRDRDPGRARATGDAGSISSRRATIELRGAVQIETAHLRPRGRRAIVTINAGAAARPAVAASIRQRCRCFGSTGGGGTVTVRAGEIELRDTADRQRRTFGDGRGGRGRGHGPAGCSRGLARDPATSPASGADAEPGHRRAAGSVTVRRDRIEIRDRGRDQQHDTRAQREGGAVTAAPPADRAAASTGAPAPASGATSRPGSTGDAGRWTVRPASRGPRPRARSAPTPSARARRATSRSGPTACSAGRPGPDRLLGPGRRARPGTWARAGTLLVDGGAIRTVGTGGTGGAIDVDRLRPDRACDKGEVTSNGVEPRAGASLITLEAPTHRPERQPGDLAHRQRASRSRAAGWCGCWAGSTVVSADSEVAASSSVETAGLQANLGSQLRLSPGAFLDAGRLLGQGCAAAAGGALVELHAPGQRRAAALARPAARWPTGGGRDAARRGAAAGGGLRAGQRGVGWYGRPPVNFLTGSGRSATYRVDAPAWPGTCLLSKPSSHCPAQPRQDGRRPLPVSGIGPCLSRSACPPSVLHRVFDLAAADADIVEHTVVKAGGEARWRDGCGTCQIAALTSRARNVRRTGRVAGRTNVRSQEVESDPWSLSTWRFS